MLEKKITIKNETGLSPRAASFLVREATKFKAESYIIKNGNEYNCKSIMNIMSMLVRQDEEILLKVEGSDEEKAFDALVDLIENLKEQ
ncbi:HPr family phosphocarrier protein [Clostridium formicaceticum]|uniref:Phosphocarrier protein HPr n=1 Tax=Clostridium formicaceticum TaxID=1497 RepID=A0AAC9RJ60_9CLOT|nr:HPr family phosphocarrier protein [Clostridium formicaceticum]AOY76063.1 serine kinase [Clostridium formicaceticum]ARE86425.1 Phosphocarrier protein HPr [Clostridium formicaceticum]